MSKKATGTEQHNAFVKAARELGCDESETAFDKVLKKIASAPPPKSVQRRKAKIAHKSDCAVHDAPAYKAGACTCGAEPKKPKARR